MTFFRSCIYYCFVCFIGAGLSEAAANNDALARRASWEVPAPAQIREVIDAWVSAGQYSDTVREQVKSLWTDSDSLDAATTLDHIVQTAGMLDPRAEQLASTLRSMSSDWMPPDPSLFEDQTIPLPIRNNLRLAYGVFLGKIRMFDESLAQLSGLTADDVADPASLLFYLGASQYRLRDKEKGLATLEKLLEREEAIPIRFATVARIMKSELDALKVDSLDEVARLMDSIHVRLGHGHAGKRVRTEEEEVITKLDKMIKKLEEQQQQQQQKMASGKQGGQPSKGGPPLQDSFLPEMKKPGEIDRKSIDGPIDWGNLPPAERQEALQQLGEDFPSHYREVIEEYFRDLSRKEAENR